MLIAIGSDHRGYELKQKLSSYLSEMGHQYQDMGCFDKHPIDYPDIAATVATAVANREGDRGVLICGTGIGMSITANKIIGIRAALCNDPVLARMARQHNNANILCLGGSTIGESIASEIISAFLTSEFEGDRHSRRLNKITRLEQPG